MKREINTGRTYSLQGRHAVWAQLMQTFHYNYSWTVKSTT